VSYLNADKTGCNLLYPLTTHLIEIVTMAKRDYRVKTPTAKEQAVKSRQYTVGYAPNRQRPNPSPQLIISGKWLNDLGFTVGSHFTLTRQAGRDCNLNCVFACF
ncbi:SymE family type I addiction module toxin, partial [Providencia stuartii]